MRAHVEPGNVHGLWTVILEDGRVFHDRDEFQVREMMERMGLVEVATRKERAANATAIVHRELGAGVEVQWTAEANRVVLTCVFGGKSHLTTIPPLEDEVAAAELWCREILGSA